MKATDAGPARRARDAPPRVLTDCPTSPPRLFNRSSSTSKLFWWCGARRSPAQTNAAGLQFGAKNRVDGKRAEFEGRVFGHHDFRIAAIAGDRDHDQKQGTM
jgi:hypothetical protein